MRDELEDVLDLYAGMPPEGQEHWRKRALSSVSFESDAEREEFLAALRQRDKQPPAPRAAPAESGPPAATSAPGAAAPPRFQPGQRVKANLAGLSAGGVQLSQNVEAAFATVERQVSDDPPVYRLKLLISFRGITQIDVPADRIRAM